MAVENSFANDGVTNGTTDVEIVGAPGQGQIRRVVWINVHNTNTSAATVLIDYLNGGSRRRIKTNTNLASKDSFEFPTEGPGIVLDETDTSIVISLSGAPSMSELDWVAVYEEETREAVVN